MKKMNDTHLGDGLYASCDGYQITLKANDPIEPSDTVYLDEHVCSSLVAFISSLRAE